MKQIYLDYAATTPVDPHVIDDMEPYFFKKFGNATSSHSFGRDALGALEESRQMLSSNIGAKPSEITFTSGATEASNYCLFGVAQSLKEKGNHIIVSAIEHHCVLGPVEQLAKQGFDITFLPVDKQGMVDPGGVKKAITDKTILLAVMQANNEIGTIQPIEKIGKIARDKGVLFFVDAVQAVGHIPVDVKKLNADFLSLSAHKFYGPKGIGALYIREGIKIPSLLYGGGQESGRRATTQNVAGAVGLARALRLCHLKLDTEIDMQTELRNKLLKEIPKRIDGVTINGHLTKRLPNNAHFSFEGLQAESLLMSLDFEGFAMSMGSACTSGSMNVSHVLKAINLEENLAAGSIRITVGRWTTPDDIDLLIEKLPGMVKGLRNV